jgi:hypothetical protein
MIKFEEHDGLIFKMLDKPVPLTADAEMPCLVRFITHGVIGEYVMEHWLDCNQKNVPIYVDGVDSDGDVTVWIDENRNSHHCCPFPMFEIIGTFVEEGSKDWALYQMMQGEKVTKGHLEHIYWDYDARPHLQCISEYNCGTLQIMVSPEIWIKTADKDGWQIYKEPKPLLADTGIGDIVKTNLGDWLQIVDTPCLRFGHDECHRTHDGLYWDECGVCDVDSTYRLVAIEPLAPEGTKEWAWQMMLLGKIIIHSEYSHENATWKMNNGTARSCLAGMSACSKEQWVANAIGNGWEIYEEPKEEPLKEPDYVICKRCGGTGYEIKEPCDAPNPESATQTSLPVSDATQLKVGDWAEVHGCCQARVINIEYSPISGEAKYATLSTNNRIRISSITRKLSPSEVIVRIGCLSGTVDVSIILRDAFFLKHSDGSHSLISLSALDTQTREIVESLLKAQERGDIK